MKTTSTLILSVKLALVISTLLSVTAAAQPSLGTSALLEGPGAGSDSVVLAMAAPTDTWTATANDSWLHLDVANQSGTGSTNVVFSYDANPDATRTGTLTIAGQTLTVTQAGSTYVAAPGPVTTLVASGLSDPAGVALDGADNVYFADSGNYAIKEWTAVNNTATTLVALGSGNEPAGVAVDGAGNIYYSYLYTGLNGYFSTALAKWTAANHTVTTLTTPGTLVLPGGVAVDGVGNVYYTYRSVFPPSTSYLKKWTAASKTVTTLASTLYHS